VVFVGSIDGEVYGVSASSGAKVWSGTAAHSSLAQTSSTRLLARLLLRVDRCGRDVAGEQDAVGGAVELLALPMEGGGVDDENDGPAAAGADLRRGGGIRRQLDVGPVAGLEPLGPDAGQEAGSASMLIQPLSSSSAPMAAGLWRSTYDRNRL